MTHAALKMARDALAFYAAADCWRAQEVLPVIEAALQSTHPAVASKVGAQIDMRDSVPSAEPAAVFDDPRVQTVYDILCDADDVPPPEQHWEGWAARRIVDALAAPAPAQASPRDDYEEGDSFAGMDATPPAAAAPLAQPLTDTRILEMAAEAETPAWGEWYTDEDALFRFARAVEAHKGQP